MNDESNLIMNDQSNLIRNDESYLVRNDERNLIILSTITYPSEGQGDFWSFTFALEHF